MGSLKGVDVFTMLIGEVDAVPGVAGDHQEHKISTRFFSFVGPLIPFESMCVTFEHQWRREEAASELLARVGQMGLPSSPEALVDRVSSMTTEQLELVFATAWYQSVDNPSWKSLREVTWARLA